MSCSCGRHSMWLQTAIKTGIRYNYIPDVRRFMKSRLNRCIHAKPLVWRSSMYLRVVVLFAILQGHVLISFVYVSIFAAQTMWTCMAVKVASSHTLKCLLSHPHTSTIALESQKWAFILKVSRENAACEVERKRESLRYWRSPNKYSPSVCGCPISVRNHKQPLFTTPFRLLWLQLSLGIARKSHLIHSHYINKLSVVMSHTNLWTLEMKAKQRTHLLDKFTAQIYYSSMMSAKNQSCI